MVQSVSRREAEGRNVRRRAKINDPVGLAREQDEEDRLQRDLRGMLRTLNRSIPRRGFGASITDVITSAVSNRFGGALERQLEASDLAMREGAEIAQTSRARAATRVTRRGLAGQIREARARGDTGAVEQLLPIYREQIALGKAQNANIRESSTRLRAFFKEVTNTSTVLKAFGAAAIGSAGSVAIGAFTFGLGNVVAGPLIEGIGTVLTSGLEKVFGDPQLIASTRTALADSIRAAGGQAGVGFGGVAARAGLSVGTLTRLAPELERAGAISAGNKALEEQIALFKVWEQTLSRGTDAGVAQTLGGALGTALAGQMPAAEQFGNLLGGTGVRRIAAGSPIDENGNPVDPRSRASRAGIGLPGARLSDVDRFVGDLEKLRGRILLVNETLSKNADNNIEVVEGSQFLREELDTQAEALRQKLPQIADIVGQGLVGVIDKQTKQLITDPDRVSKALADALVAAPKPEPEALLRQMGPQIQAREELRIQQRELTLGLLNPIEELIDRITAPMLPAATGLPPGLSRAQQAEVGDVQSIIDELNARNEQDFTRAVEFVRSGVPGVSPGLGNQAADQFAASLQKVQDIGQQIADIQIGVQTKQAAYQAAQFDYQLRLARRSLADAHGLVSGIGSSLGAIERRIYNLQRQSQALGLAQSQRQINFQLALAGFQIPGLTPEEQAARIKQAKIEADFAQKQLDIQKKLFGLQGKQFDISASRQVQDLISQIGLLERGRQLNIDTAIAEKKIAALTKLQARENKIVAKLYSDAVNQAQDIMQLGADLVTATGKGLAKVTTLAIDAYRRTMEAIIAFQSNISSGGDHDSPALHAAGVLFTTQGPTTMTVGEAGPETVAVLSNPRTISGVGTGGSGGTNVYISVTGNTFTSEEASDRFIIKLSDEVERRLNRRASGMGLGGI